jgi:UDP-glucose 4-epimerase
MTDLAERVRDLLGSTSEVIHVPYDEAYGEGYEDMQRRVPDTTRAHQLVGFAPKVALDELIVTVAGSRRAGEVPSWSDDDGVRVN